MEIGILMRMGWRKLRNRHKSAGATVLASKRIEGILLIMYLTNKFTTSDIGTLSNAVLDQVCRQISRSRIIDPDVDERKALVRQRLVHDFFNL